MLCKIFTFIRGIRQHLPEKADQVYPYFVLCRLPVGLVGLVFAAFFAATMSSIVFKFTSECKSHLPGSGFLLGNSANSLKKDFILGDNQKLLT